MESLGHVVFGGEHYNPLGMIRTLGENGERPDAIIVKGKRPLASRSKWINRLWLVDSVEQGYELLLKEYGRYGSEGPRWILHTGDDATMSYLDKRYEQIAEMFVFPNAGTSGRVTEFQDKDRINKCAEAHGLNVAPSWVTDRGTIPEGVEYPVITKAIASTEGAWKDDVFICFDDNELMDAFGKIQSEKVLVQKFIDKVNEICIDGYSWKKGKGVEFSIVSTYNYILLGEYSYYMTVYGFEDADLGKRIAAVIEEVGYEGVFCVEFLVDSKGDLWFLEVNFRNSGWSYASTKAGIPLPTLWAKSMLADSDGRREVRYALVGMEPFTAMVEFADFRKRVGKSIGIREWFREMMACKCKFYLGGKDFGPIRGFLFSWLADKFSRSANEVVAENTNNHEKGCK